MFGNRFGINRGTRFGKLSGKQLGFLSLKIVNFSPKLEVKFVEFVEQTSTFYEV